MADLTPQQAAEKLGIPDEDVDVFVSLLDVLRTRSARDAEVTRLRTELEAVDEALVQAGIEYPLGARGVRDLGAMLRNARDSEPEGEADA
ncbi:hypothetical protein OG529_04310 [Streptomyces longwoodensis]|uniref:hypothetical protein n=1 Tax=Streptomyces longwoodensis TaxID=68231 RepID=UPI00325352A6